MLVSKYFTEKINCSNTKWAILIDSMTSYLKQHKFKQFESAAALDNQNFLENLTQRLSWLQSNIAKAITISVIKITLDIQVQKLQSGSVERVLLSQVDSFLSQNTSLNENLPMAVYFFQSLMNTFGNTKQVAEKFNLQSIRNFNYQYMTLSSSEALEELQFKGSDYTKYFEMKRYVLVAIEDLSPDHKLFHALMKDLLPPISSTPGADVSPNRELLWRVLVNEFWLRYLLAEDFEVRDQFIAKLDSQLEQLKNSYSSIHLIFLDNFVKNFPSIAAL